MATVKKMPSSAIVNQLAGAIDFYMWLGLPCARKWPRWTHRVPHPDEKANQEIFAYASKMWKWLPEFLKANYRQMAVSTPVTARDIFMRGYINASWRTEG